MSLTACLFFPVPTVPYRNLGCFITDKAGPLTQARKYFIHLYLDLAIYALALKSKDKEMCELHRGRRSGRKVGRKLETRERGEEQLNILPHLIIRITPL